MGFLSKFEGKMEDAVEGTAEKMSGSSISPVQIAKKAEKQMRREKMVGAGKQYAPTLYTVLISPEDDRKMFNYYPTLAGETETYIMARAADSGLSLDGHPLVRFLPDPDLRRGKFDVVAEMVTSSIVERLRADEMKRYGIEAPLAAGPARVKPVVNRAAQHPRNPAVAGGIASGAAAFVTPATIDAASAAGASGAAVQDADFSGFDSELGLNTFDNYSDNATNTKPATQEADGLNAIEGFSAEPLLDVYLYDAMRDTAYTLSGKPERIGREATCEIVVPDINASRVHAEIRLEPTGAWVITDLGSTNGLYINGRKIKSAPLRDADVITIGTTELEFQKLS
jgi:hypothetical protein